MLEALDADLQDAIDRGVRLLMACGPALGDPHVHTLAHWSRHPNLKELRFTYRGDAYRIFFAFDPRRVAILLTGGRKPNEKWYKHALPAAEKLYDEYLQELRREGLLP